MDKNFPDKMVCQECGGKFFGDARFMVPICDGCNDVDPVDFDGGDDDFDNACCGDGGYGDGDE